MDTANRTRNVVIVSCRAELEEIARKAAGKSAEVVIASNGAEAFEKIRQLRPDIIILGPMNARQEMQQLRADIRAGWISHHASLLVLEFHPDENAHWTIRDESENAGEGRLAFIDASSGPLLPSEQLIPKLQEILALILNKRENQFRKAMLDPDKFCLVWEQIPGPGAFEMRQEAVLENARRAARSGMVCAMSITDNPGGNPAIATDVLCAEIKKSGIDPLVHIAFRDRSRNQAESLLFQLAALDIHNVLILTGDYPSNLGFTGRSKPVFDLDSVNGLRLVAEMNRGLERDILRKPVRLAPTGFFAGAAFSPFKQLEAEVMCQFYKLEKKMAAGADFVITQVGYDARKLQELTLWMKHGNRRIPALAGIYVLSHPVARAMHDNNIPGCVVTRKLLNQIAAEAEGKDKGKQARLDRAAKMYAIAKGLGYKGAYVSGQGLPFENLEYIVSKGNELAPNWMDLVREFDYSQDNGFYFFEKEASAGLNSAVPSRRTQRPRQTPIYLLSRLMHGLLFDPGSFLFRPMQHLMQRIDASSLSTRIFHWLERWSKSTLYACKDCGDCALFDVAYLCPVSQCPKDQRNAPCGGSYQGWCEVYPGEKRCIWVKAYERLKAQNREDEIGKYLVPPCNWQLLQTSSWINYFLGRDHSAKIRGIHPPVRKSEI